MVDCRRERQRIGLTEGVLTAPFGAHLFCLAIPVTASGSNDAARQDFPELVDSTAAIGFYACTVGQPMNMPVF